jgi:hypothetical protein
LKKAPSRVTVLLPNITEPRRERMKTDLENHVELIAAQLTVALNAAMPTNVDPKEPYDSIIEDWEIFVNKLKELRVFIDQDSTRSGR